LPAEPPTAGEHVGSGAVGAHPWGDPARRLVWARVLLALFPLLLYVGSLTNDFLVDDRIIVASNTRLAPGQSPWEIFRRPEQFADFTLPYYRPLTNLTYWVDAQLWGDHPLGFHTTNWLLHSAATLLVFEAATALGGHALGAWFAGLLFAAHPMHTESIDMVQGRTDLLAAALVLLGLVAALRATQAVTRRNAVAWGAGNLTAVIAALLTKEVAATWPLLLLGAWWAAGVPGRTPRSRWLWLLAAGGGALGGYLAVRLVVLGGIAPGGLLDLGPARIALVPITLATYLGWLLWPFAFSFVWTLPAPTGWADPRLWGSLALLLALAGLAAWLVRRHRLAAFALGWILVTLLPVANLIPIPGFSLAQRYLYLPSVGFCILVGLGLEWAWRAARHPVGSLCLGGALIGLLAVYSATIQLRTAQWVDPVHIAEQMVARAPTSFFAQSTLGLEYLRRGQAAEAIPALRRACGLEPGNPRAWNNLGVALARAGRLAEARTAYERAIGLAPEHTKAHENLGHVLRALGLHEQAEAAFRRARTLSGQ
jgi:hypothetical protein